MQSQNTNVTKVSFITGVKSLPEPQRTKITAKIDELVFLRFIERISSHISPERLAELQHLESQMTESSGTEASQESRSAVIQWLASAVPDYQALLDTALQEVDAELTAKMAAAK